MSITFVTISALADNYIWLLHDGVSAVVIDPGDAVPVIDELEKRKLKLTAIFVTHHHWDHTRGITGLLAVFPDASVYGPRNEDIPHRTCALSEGDIVELSSPRISLSVLDVPGHTSGHIAYLSDNSLFCGDTLFSGGCGRVFDGSFEDLHKSLCKIAELPGLTLIYCAHEYTLENLKFAQWIEPDNYFIKNRIKQCQKHTSHNIPTMPSLLITEMACNPFLRTNIPSVIAKAEQYAGKKLTTSSQVFSVLRTWRDTHFDRLKLYS